ncbi:uncharacterized protein LOC142563061 isoform X2 [Dermacentor variabilis]
MVGAVAAWAMFAAMSCSYFRQLNLDQSLRIAVIFAIAVTLASSDNEQKIQFKTCPDHQDAKDIEITSAVARDMEVGKTISVDVTVVAKKEFKTDPKLSLTITTSNQIKLPCVFNVGSCTYKLCNGETPMEKFLGGVWDNKCPIAAKEYKKTVSYFIPAIAKVAIGDGRLHLRGEMMDGGKLVGCQEFDVALKV